MIHVLQSTLANLHGHYSRDLPPILTIASGDTVHYKTLDAGWCEFDQSDPFAQPIKLAGRDRQRDPGHALVGPVQIEGAKKGMTLEIHFKTIRTGAWGWSSGGGWKSEINTRLKLDNGPEWTLRWALDSATGIATNQRGQQIAMKPFMGNFGMPPDEDGSHSTFPPRFCGGNMDCKELTEGSRVFLPISVDGALFSIGDGHAIQGDGEVTGPALECPMELVEVEFRLHPDMKLSFPCAWTSTGWLALGFHEDLDEAAMIALDSMLDLMNEKYQLERKEALALSSLLVDLRVTQIVNGVKGVHAVLPHHAIPGILNRNITR
ncbi:MAG: acetamidase/formamidase family protein [Chloroflexi bacterium]|nr:acetamidase/formamidase family protein [Chloroflexota bacterium]